ncbi:tRNA (adenosine(37)-N6)-threonylcarbamoyltransferase complex ATPase subunit type 1 TsaE [Ferrimicrobium acidiphilum]|uniref:tRNA (adenosine(37)-N6)-threonylcarbamoyltransferase complex ATPase subunit type 1 TsaE n=1 Tax=Ferrimicrobium acidiphilum TaxID=121039 RepID=UPI0023F328F5|nr:tRNA (adenosine(37)-N6)-threonylcarbamoyltransferase complex ATPase subunit type 1 TsaE [Ferrimicrobium acidiphilum]
MKLIVETAGAMFELGHRLGSALQPGDLVLLTGELGAGKTTFTQGVADGLGIQRSVTSPTFVTVKPYLLAGGGELYHVDLYRVDDPDYLYEQGILEELERGAMVVVEWAERSRLLDEYERLLVRIQLEGEGRRLEVEATPGWQERLRWLL